MKKIFSNNRLTAIALLTVFSIANSSMAIANPGDTLVPVEMRFAGLINNKPLFQLNFAGTPQQNEFTIIVTDEEGNSLYRENITGENFTKKFLLNTDEIGDNVLRFEITCKKTKRSVTYEVNRNTRFVQDVAIREFR